MTVFFAITIDTEVNKSLNWTISKTRSFSSVLDGIPNRLTPTFDTFDAKPTYLLSSEVIENKDCVKTLKKIDNCELGTHLHGDLIEPKRNVCALRNAYTLAMQNTYPNNIEYLKLKNLTNLFIKQFGFKPTSFRAGRFAAGTNTINSLEKLGYLVDTSVTPLVDWNYAEGRANFVGARNQPYFPKKENILESGNSKVLEVPVSITGSKLKKCLHVQNNNYTSKFVNRITDKIFPSYWLRPSTYSSKEMIYVINKIISENQKKDNIVLNMMFHSMEIIPNASPYTKTEKDCNEFIKRLKDVLNYGKRHNFNFISLSELYPNFKDKIKQNYNESL